MLHGDALGDAVQIRQEARRGHIGQREEIGLAQGLHLGLAHISGGHLEAQLSVLGQVRDLHRKEILD